MDQCENRIEIDQLYKEYFIKYGIELSPIKNFNSIVDLEESEYIRNFNTFDGVILSGSGDISIPISDIYPGKVSKYSFARDLTENYLINIALKKSKKIIGICHGMQKINEYFDGSIEPYYHCKKDTYSAQAIEHMVSTSGDVLANKKYIVNQYHDHCITLDGLASNMTVLAVDPRFNTIECFENKILKIICMQWHPERKSSSNEISNKLLNYFL